MRGKNDLPAGFTGKPDGWKGKENPGVIGNVTLLVLRDIEIDPNKYPFPFQFDLVYGANGHPFTPCHAVSMSTLAYKLGRTKNRLRLRSPFGLRVKGYVNFLRRRT
jgi:hypothetical protein